MATVKAVLNTKYQSKDGRYPIVIRLIDGRRQRLHSTGHKVSEKYWNADSEEVIRKHPDAAIINADIEEEKLKAKRYVSECHRQGIPIDLDLVFSDVKSHSFTAYLRHRATQHQAADQLEMYYKANRYVKELTSCFGREIHFSEITQDLLREFDAWLKAGEEGERKPNAPNTRHKKFEFLGKYYGNALEEGKATGKNPFKLYLKEIRQTPVKKEKLTVEQFEAIEALPLRDGAVCFARDLFLFAYYNKGARFETCITLPKTAVQGERLYFQTNKGKKHLSTALHPRLEEIISKYIDNPTDTVFGRVNEAGELSKAQYRGLIGSQNYMVNRSLKTVAELAGIPFALSFHHSRHTFAFHLKQVSDNIHVIKQALGHSKTETTERYLKDLDDAYLDVQLEKLYKKKKPG
jgi:integrase/recombinase XerD